MTRARLFLAGLTILAGGASPPRAGRALPAGFDPTHASPADLQRYALPPEPDALHPAAHAAWAHMVSGAKYFVAPSVRAAGVRHLPMVRPGTDAHISRESNLNWSGVVDVGNVVSFGPTSMYVLYGEWVVPIAQQAFGSCTGTVYSATWLGIDGYSNSDVLQGGTESDAACSGGRLSPNYFVWFEWYPGYTYEITNLPVTAGDDINAVLVADSSVEGTLYIENESTNQYTAVNINAPAGTHLVGNTAEWIVERPSINNALPTLTNYVSDFVTNMVAVLNDGGAVFGGSGTSAYPAHYLTMVDSSSNAISEPFAVGSATTAFHAAGPAR